MQFIEIPEFPRLRGKEAIETLYSFVNEFEEQRGKELTEKQTTALINLAKGLISYIETEMRSGASNKDVKEMRFERQLKRTIMKRISQRVRSSFF